MFAKISAWFHNSETILLARATAFVGIVMQVAATVDPQLFANLVGAKWFPVFLIGYGVLTEYARRRRATDLVK